MTSEVSAPITQRVVDGRRLGLIAARPACVVRTPDKADRRRNVITITAVGQRRLAQLDDA